MFDFRNKVLLLSGASGGIGREIASLFLKAGARVALADIDGTGLSTFALELDASGKRVKSWITDTSDPRSIEFLLRAVKDEFGGIDYLVPAAGIYPNQSIESTSDGDWRRVLAVILDGVFFLIKRALPLLRDGGSVVNIGSVAGHTGVQNHAHYAASKAGVISFTRSLALEVGSRIRVNAVSPGVIETPMTEELLRQRGPELIDQTPLRRVGKPEEVASVVAFLCSDMATFVHGEVIHVNGGLFMAG